MGLLVNCLPLLPLSATEAWPLEVAYPGRTGCYWQVRCCVIPFPSKKELIDHCQTTVRPL
eukprot:6028333-Prorocentrum_lima.AAC.1